MKTEMKSFTTDSQYNITKDSNRAAYLFEQLAGYGFEIQVQHKNEDGMWGGKGDDEVFMFPGKSITPERVVKHFLKLRDRDDVEAEMAAEQEA